MIKKSLKEKYENFLSKDEELKLVTGYSINYLRERFAFYVVFPGAIFILLGVGAGYFGFTKMWIGSSVGVFIALIIAYLWVLILNYSHKYLLTDRRVIQREGFLKIKLTSILYDKVTHLTVNQGFLERFILEYGTVVIDTAGSSGDEIVLNYVANPIKFKNKLEDLINEHQKTSSHHSKETIRMVQTKKSPVLRLLHPFKNGLI